jgi:hypothetical protein
VVGEHGMRGEGNDMLRMDGLYSLDAGETDMASGAKRKQSLYDEHRKRMHFYGRDGGKRGRTCTEAHPERLCNQCNALRIR